MNAPLAEDRLQRILDLLARHGSLRTTALTEALGVSGATTRRDLDTLERRGLIRKMHGGAALASQDQGYQDRAALHQGRKTDLAQTALGLIRPGQTVGDDVAHGGAVFVTRPGVCGLPETPFSSTTSGQ